MCAKMEISAYILEIVENDPFLRLQMRANITLNNILKIPSILK